MQNSRLPAWIENYWCKLRQWWKPIIIGPPENLFKKIAICTTSKRNRLEDCLPTFHSTKPLLVSEEPWRGETLHSTKTTIPKFWIKCWMIPLHLLLMNTAKKLERPPLWRPPKISDLWSSQYFSKVKVIVATRDKLLAPKQLKMTRE